MKALISKYKWWVLYYLMFLIIVLYFEPKQTVYYLDNDIKTFKSKYFNWVLIGIWITICSLFLSILVAKTKSLKKTIALLLYVSFVIGINLFILQDLFLAGALFINRQIKRGSTPQTYIAIYLAGVEKNKSSFVPYDLSIKDINTDRKLKNKLYNPGIKDGDTLVLKFNRGLFNINFLTEPFPDN